MEFFTTDLDGLTEINPTKARRREILQSVLEDCDADYPEVYLTIRNGPVIGYRQDGCLLWEEAGVVVRILPRVDLKEAQQAWSRAITGNWPALEALPWRDMKEQEDSP